MEEKEYFIEDELLIKINLQLFANPEDEGRTEEPTEKKIREAREKGKVAKTSELSSALVLLVTFIILAFMAKNVLGEILEYMRGIFTNLYKKDFSIENYRNIVVLSGITGIKIIGPIMLASIVIAFISDVVQVGFQISLHPLKPELSKISFTFEKLKQKIFFSRQVGVNLLKAVIKMIIVISISILIIKSDYSLIMKTINMGVFSAIKVISWTAFKMVLWVSIVLIVISFFDYLYQKWEHIQSLKMTVQEVKEERKQYEGDPLIKAKQKERFRSLILRRIIQEVPKADVVVTNPTHFAVALLYDPEYMAAAQVIAKGSDLMAARIKEIAEENYVPIMENRPLARALYNEVEIGEEIPNHLFEAVALILGKVYKMKEEAV